MIGLFDGLGSVTRHPDIDAHSLQVGTSLMFWVDHYRDRMSSQWR
jgi:hypothetical protein